MENELIQYFIVNQELNMSPGKIAAQVAHVATFITYYESYNPNPKCVLFQQWFNNYAQKKIILRGKQKDLEKLVNQDFYYIRDNGLTEITHGSLTCVGLGVMWKSKAQKYVKRLQLL